MLRIVPFLVDCLLSISPTPAPLDSVVVPQVGGHGMVAGGGEDEPLLSGDGEDGPPFCLSHPNSSGCGLDGGDGVVVPQDGGHAERPGQVLCCPSPWPGHSPSSSSAPSAPALAALSLTSPVYDPQ